MKDIIKSVTPQPFLVLFRYFKNKYSKIRFNSKYKGNGVICPICNSNYKIFAPFGKIKRQNAECHTCKSLERHRLIYLYLKDKLDFLNKEKKQISLLHIAPEKVFYNIFDSLDSIEYFPCDLYPERYDYKGNTTVLKVDITNIPFETNKFDLIICNHVLEHIDDDAVAMSELYRVMRRRGKGIFQVPIDSSRKKTYEDLTLTTSEEREKAFGQHDHVRIYGRDYPKRLKHAGFSVIEDNFINTFSHQEMYKYGLMESELIYLCSK